MKRNTSCLISFLVLISSLLCTGELYAAPYYEGKMIKLIVGAGPGGTYDRMARLVAKHLPRHIPGKPTIIVENMPGATGIKAANHLYNNEKPDGLTIESILRGLPFPQLLKASGVKFDLRKFSWIGSTSEEPTVLAIRSELPYKNFDDLRKAKGPIYIGGTGPQDATTQFAMLLKEFMGLNIAMVPYSSGTDIMLGIERKEVDGRPGSYSGLELFIEKGLLRPLVRGRASVPEIENLPVDEDLTLNKTGKTIMAMRSVVDRLGLPYVAPPGTPDKIVNILREGFAKMAKDPEVQKDAKKLRLRVKYEPVDEYLKMLRSLFNQPDEIIKEFSKHIKL